MATSWLLTYFGFGYALAMSIFGPAIFSTVLKDMAHKGTVSKMICNVLLVLQAGCSMVSMVVVLGLLFRTDKQLGLPELYGWITVGTFFAGLSIVLVSTSYLNRLIKLGN